MPSAAAAIAAVPKMTVSHNRAADTIQWIALLQVSTTAASPEFSGRGSSADGFGSMIGSRIASTPNPPILGGVSRQPSSVPPSFQTNLADRQPLAPLGSYSADR